MLRAHALVWLWPCCLPLACAGDDGACTEIGCESTASVSYNDFTLSGPYDLSIDLSDEKVVLRCNDPGSMEEADNPEDITCNASGFEIVGERADHTSILVTIVDDSGDPVAVNQTVQLAVAPDGTLTPNGPDCPPTCYERFGSVVP